MIPKTPQSYRIPEPTRSEIIALMLDLDLVFVRKSFCPLPPAVKFPVKPLSPSGFLDKHMKSDKRLSDFMNRYHHYKDFTSVYSSDYNYEDLSFSWD